MRPSLLVAVAVAISCSAAAAPAAPPAVAPATTPASPHAVTLRGTLRLPDAAADAAGVSHRLTGMSGIAWLGADRYAIVMDDGPGLVLLQVALAATGAPTAATELLVVPLAPPLDWEDVAGCPPGLGNADEVVPSDVVGRLLVCEETTPAIRLVDAAAGRHRELLPLPDLFRSRRPNRGPEGLAVEPDGSIVWTATEESLPADGPASATGGGTVVRLVALATAGGGAAGQFAYAVDPPHEFVRVFAGPVLSGVTAVTVLGDGRLLVLERSGCPGLPPFENRIYLVDPRGATDVTPLAGDLAAHPDVVGKQLLWRDQLGCNLEGFCLGPRLSGQARSVVAIADNGGVGTPNQLIGFALEPQSQDLPLRTIVAAAAFGALVLGLAIYRLSR